MIQSAWRYVQTFFQKFKLQNNIRNIVFKVLSFSRNPFLAKYYNCEIFNHPTYYIYIQYPCTHEEQLMKQRIMNDNLQWMRPVAKSFLSEITTPLRTYRHHLHNLSQQNFWKWFTSCILSGSPERRPWRPLRRWCETQRWAWIIGQNVVTTKNDHTSAYMYPSDMYHYTTVHQCLEQFTNDNFQTNHSAKRI